MDIDKIIDELKAEGWWLDNHFYRNNRDFLKAFAKKLESKQSSITAVVQAKPEKVLNTYPYDTQLKRIDQLNQNQCSLKDQLTLLRPFANRLGLYDAADYLRD
jgi:hypothetical protein